MGGRKGEGGGEAEARGSKDTGSEGELTKKREG